MRYLVTGATGFIGARLVQILIARGQEVRALVRATSKVAALQHAGVELVQGDIGDPYSLAKAVEGTQVVLHLAGSVKALAPADYFRANAEGTANVALAAADADSRPRFVLVSSLSAAGPLPFDRLRTENDPAAPVSLYGQSKLEAERAVRMLAGRLEATIVRPPIVYGPGDKEFVQSMFRMARLGVVLKVGMGHKRYSLVYVDDLCEGILAAAERGKRVSAGGGEGLYYFSDGAVRTWDEVGRAACAAMGKTARVVPVPEAMCWVVAAASSWAAKLRAEPAIFGVDKMREIREENWTCAIDRAQAELEYQPKVDLAAGMRASAEWYRAQQAS